MVCCELSSLYSQLLFLQVLTKAGAATIDPLYSSAIITIGDNTLLHSLFFTLQSGIYYTGIDKAEADTINPLYSSATITVGVNTILYSLL